MSTRSTANTTASRIRTGHPTNLRTDERRVKLESFIRARLQRFTYLYDFGDGWEHRITVEDVLASKGSGPYVVCTAGENACPPEGVGGAGGYASLLEAIANPQHERHQEMLDWLGYPFDPHAFDLNAINQRVARDRSPKPCPRSK
jgi:hypothetical protein